VETTGSLLAWEELTLNTRVPGTLARLRVDLGDPVEAGQVVAELDRREFELGVEQANAALRAARDAVVRARAQVEASRATLGQVRDSRKTFEAGLNRARASLEEAETNLERSRALVDRQLIAKQEFDAARTRYEVALAQFQTSQVEMSQFPDRVRVAEAQLQSDLSAVQVAESEIMRREAELGLARKRLEDATLRSPIRGAVARRHVNVGEFLRDNQPVFTIVRTDILKFAGTVPERAALDIQVGQAIELRVEPVPQRGFPGRVTRVSPAVDPASRSVLLEAEVPNPDGVLKPGLFARGAVSSRRDTGVVYVPEGAVSYFAGVSRVYVAAGDRAQERQVKLGDRRDGAVEVIEGVKAGEQVIVSDLGRLHDGAPIQAAPRPGT
jgi:RND family efflux transporter MFP subunit